MAEKTERPIIDVYIGEPPEFFDLNPYIAKNRSGISPLKNRANRAVEPYPNIMIDKGADMDIFQGLRDDYSHFLRQKSMPLDNNLFSLGDSKEEPKITHKRKAIVLSATELGYSFAIFSALFGLALLAEGKTTGIALSVIGFLSGCAFLLMDRVYGRSGDN